MAEKPVNIKDKIEELFEENYKLLQLEGGHSLTNSVKNYAKDQVLYYWEKLSEIALKVTETEVRLTLPELMTSKDRHFTIEGVVDIVREDNETWMYDIKTHDRDYIVENLHLYEEQLNVYTYIWLGLREQQLDHTAIISTSIPEALRNAIRENNKDAKEHYMKLWDPLIPLDFDIKKVKETIASFAAVVDSIEDHEFCPPPISKLKEKVPGTRTHEQFGTRVCRNCDARFSCDTFREYAIEKSGKLKANFLKYYNDFGSDADRDDWLNANLDIDNIPVNID